MIDPLTIYISLSYIYARLREMEEENIPLDSIEESRIKKDFLVDNGITKESHLKALGVRNCVVEEQKNCLKKAKKIINKKSLKKLEKAIGER
jgi:hypothetical protein